MISFWQVVTRGARVRTRRQVQALTVELASHVQKVAPELWQLFEEGAREMTKRKRQWQRKLRTEDVTNS